MVFNDIINSIKILSYKVDTVFMNSQNSEICDLLRLLLNLSDKANLERIEKYVALSKLTIYYTGKI